jgi:hypothetical protein
MNEQIRELAEQCGFRSNPDLYDRNQSFDIPKFAELIVRECMNVALDRKKWVDNQAVFDPRDQAWNRARVQQSQHIVDKIKEHFGVAE